MFVKTVRRYADPASGIKGRMPARNGERFDEIVLWGRLHSGLDHKVQIASAVMPARGQALPGCVGAIPVRQALPATHPARGN